VEPGDKIIVSADIGRHGLAVFAKRKELDFGFDIPSDCAALNHLLIPILKNAQGIKFMRDPTRGGLATTLCEIAEGASLGVVIEEKEIPLTSRVKACCELLGIDPLYLANEGCAVLVVESRQAEKILSRLKKHPLGKRSRIIGSIAARPKGRVILNTSVGTQRIIDMFSSEQLPRIC
jgi:hydrogenase expression/formation protein HypE